MTSYVNTFLKTEITFIPQILDRYFGKYYSNKLCNASLWLFVIWNILHGVFDVSINALLRKMYFKEYVRIRLKSSLWYLGFYSCSALYCGATIFKHNIELLSSRKFYSFDTNEPLFNSMFSGYMVLSTFFAHCVFWETLQSSAMAINYLFLTIFVVATYFLRCLELTIALTAIIGIVKCQMEVTRCLCTLMKSDFSSATHITNISYFISICTFIMIYLVVIPLSFVIPIISNTEWNTSLVVILNCSLWGWLAAEIYNSILVKQIRHWLYHNKDPIQKTECSTLECTLFKPRDDVAYHMRIIREEIKERQAKMMALRKPKKGASMLVQTLKCMAAINRKLKKKRLSESLNCDDSEKSESEQELSQDSKEDDEKSGNSSDDDGSDFEDDNDVDVNKEKAVNVIEGKLSLQYTENDGKLKTRQVIEKSSSYVVPSDDRLPPTSDTSDGSSVNDNEADAEIVKMQLTAETTVQITSQDFNKIHESEDSDSPVSHDNK